MTRLSTYVDVDLSDFDDCDIMREARRIIERRASDGVARHGPDDADLLLEREISRIARLLEIAPGTLPAASSAAQY